MRMHSRILAVTLAFGAVACDEGVQEPMTELTAEEASEVAAEMADLGYADIEAEFSAEAFASVMNGPSLSPPVTVTRTFERTRPCPRGGSVFVEGTSVAVIDRDNHHMVVETEATRTHDACILPLRRHDREVELNGAPGIVMTSRFERQDGQPDGPQTMSFEGAFDWQVVGTDRAGTCDIDVDIVWERTAEGGYKTVDGVVCGREVHSETTWTVQGDQG